MGHLRTMEQRIIQLGRQIKKKVGSELRRVARQYLGQRNNTCVRCNREDVPRKSMHVCHVGPLLADKVEEDTRQLMGEYQSSGQLNSAKNYEDTLKFEEMFVKKMVNQTLVKHAEKRICTIIACVECNSKYEMEDPSKIERASCWEETKYGTLVPHRDGLSSEKSARRDDIRYFLPTTSPNIKRKRRDDTTDTSSDDEVSSDEPVDDDQGLTAPRQSKRKRSQVERFDPSHQHNMIEDSDDSDDDDERNWKHWFGKYCTKTECGNQCAHRNHKGCERGNQVQMRKNVFVPHSWLNYCEDHNLPEKDWKPTRRKADFEAKLQKEMGVLYHESKGTRSVKYYDHLVFKCCPNIRCICPQSSTKKKKK